MNDLPLVLFVQFGSRTYILPKGVNFFKTYRYSLWGTPRLSQGNGIKEKEKINEQKYEQKNRIGKRIALADDSP